MLASVGATPRQIRQSVYYEAFLTGRTAIPFGNCAGTVAFDRRNFCYQSVVVRAEYRTVSACLCGMADAYRRYLTFGCHSCSFRAPSGKTGGKKFSGCGNARAGKEKPPGKKRTITAAIAGCTALFILVSYFMGVQTISVGQSNHMFDDHANVSVDVQGSWGGKPVCGFAEHKGKSVTEAAVLRTAAYMVNTKEVPYTQTHIRRNGAPDLKHETTAVIQVLAVGETAYRNYLKELGLSYETAKDCAIFYNAYAGYWDGKETTWKVTDYKPGDWIRGQFCREEQMEKTPDMTDQMQIAAVTTRRPFGVDTSQSYTDSRNHHCQ